MNISAASSSAASILTGSLSVEAAKRSNDQAKQQGEQLVKLIQQPTEAHSKGEGQEHGQKLNVFA